MDDAASAWPDDGISGRISPPPRVVLTAGFARAPAALALAELSTRDECEIAGILVVRAVNPHRFRRLVRQRGWRSIPEAWRRLIGRDPAGDGPDPLRKFLSAHEVREESLRSWTRRREVPVLHVSSLNDPRAVDFIHARKPDWVVYGGGGILREGFISAAGGRILNAHAGPLPQVRGMNALEWTILLGYEPTVTIHVIDRGVDTGGIIRKIPVAVQEKDTIESLRKRCVATGIRGLRDTLRSPPSGLPQATVGADRHRQCFVLTPALRALAEKRLVERIMAMGDPR